MFSAVFLINAVLQALLLAWLIRIWRGTHVAAAALLFLPQFFLVWDNLVVGTGAWIGLGQLLQWLNAARFWGHCLFGSWLIIASGSILRLADFTWARKRWVMAVFCLLTVTIIAHELLDFWNASLMPVCEYDLVRYATRVSAQHLCSSEQAVVASDGPPIGPLVTVFVVIATGVLLALKRRFPWMMLGGIAMFVSATPPMMRYKLDNLGEVAITLGVICAIAHFAGAATRFNAVRANDNPVVD